VKLEVVSYLKYFTPLLKEEGSSETSNDIRQTTRRHISEDANILVA